MSRVGAEATAVEHPCTGPTAWVEAALAVAVDGVLGAIDERVGVIDASEPLPGVEQAVNPTPRAAAHRMRDRLVIASG